MSKKGNLLWRRFLPTRCVGGVQNPFGEFCRNGPTMSSADVREAYGGLACARIAKKQPISQAQAGVHPSFARRSRHFDQTFTNSNVRNSKRTVSGLVRFSSFRLTYAHELAPPRRLRIREPFHSSFGTYNGSRAPRRSGRAFGYSARKSRRPFYAFYAP